MRRLHSAGALPIDARAHSTIFSTPSFSAARVASSQGRTRSHAVQVVGARAGASPRGGAAPRRGDLGARPGGPLFRRSPGAGARGVLEGPHARAVRRAGETRRGAQRLPLRRSGAPRARSATSLPPRKIARGLRRRKNCAQPLRASAPPHAAPGLKEPANLRPALRTSPRPPRARSRSPRASAASGRTGSTAG